jgi:hypothetical protein
MPSDDRLPPWLQDLVDFGQGRSRVQVLVRALIARLTSRRRY